MVGLCVHMDKTALALWTVVSSDASPVSQTKGHRAPHAIALVLECAWVVWVAVHTHWECVCTEPPMRSSRGKGGVSRGRGGVPRGAPAPALTRAACRERQGGLIPLTAQQARLA